MKGLEILDIGCGGGLVCEPLCRLGATVTGVDGSGDAIQVATDHAQAQNLPITYIHASIEDLSAKNHPPVDVVTALEIVEHVADLDSFIAHAASLLKPGGLFFFSTLNRTFKSLALGKVAAEYIVRLVPPGTHQWRKFVRPSEMDRHFRNNHIHLTDLKGVVFNPFKREWSLSSDLSVNYMVFPNRWVMPIIGLIILVGGGIAFYQVGIEQGIFQLPPICKSLPLQGGSMQSMKDQLLQQPLVPCDKPAWDLFGISMAGYNGLFSLALLVYCWIAFRRGRP